MTRASAMMTTTVITSGVEDRLDMGGL